MALVHLGNPAPHRCVTDGSAESNAHTHELLDRSAPSVTYLHVPDEYSLKKGADVRDLALHLAQRSDVTNLPDHEAFLVAAHPTGGMWAHHGSQPPSWVWSDNKELMRLYSEFYGCPAGRPDDLEDTHHTISGIPGVGPWAHGQTMLKVNAGNDIQAALLGGGQVDVTGQASAATATTLTGSGFSTNAYIGCRVFATVSATQIVWGLIVSNTTTVLTVDRWYTAGTPGGAAGSTPSATATYVILGSGGPAAWFMGLTATATAPSATDTSLTGEITTAGGGLIRKICPYAHTAGANTYTLTPVFTANGTDTLPVTIAQMGVFNSMVSTDTATTMLFRTLLNATATLSASGDQLTVTETVTM